MVGTRQSQQTNQESAPVSSARQPDGVARSALEGAVFGVSVLNAVELDLLAWLASIVHQVDPLPWETFVAVPLSIAAWIIVHPRAPSRSLLHVNELERLAEQGFIMLERMRSGVRLVRLTPEGLAAAGATELDSDL